jgi:copper oxidase (laccase) domain-containing protein
LSHIEVVRAAVLKDVAHGFLGRSGGVSEGVVAGLNVGWGSGDDREAIGENRRRAVAAVLPGARLVTLHQIHSSTIVVAGDWPDENRPFADGLVTDRPGVLLGILTADCAPVLLADAQAGVVGAAHSAGAGRWPGSTRRRSRRWRNWAPRRERITAAIGPAIAARSYEVDPSFRSCW